MDIKFREVLLAGLISILITFTIATLYGVAAATLAATIAAIVTITSLANVMIVIQNKGGGD